TSRVTGQRWRSPSWRERKRFPKIQRLKLIVRDLVIASRDVECAQRLVDRLGRQLKRTKVHGEALFRLHVQVCQDGLVRIHVDVLHEPAWFIGTNGKEREIDRAKPPADVTKHRTVAAVAGEIDAPTARVHGEATPQRAISIVRTTRRKMLRGRQGNGQSRPSWRLPPP